MSKENDKTPKVPEGWIAKFDDKYKTHFYVNLKTKKSQWEAPPGTTFGDSSSADDVPPPAYSPDASHDAASQGAVPNKTDRGNFLSSHGSSRLGGILGHHGSSSQSPPPQGYGGYPQQSPYGGGYPPQGYPPQGYPPQGYGGYGQQPYGGYPPQGMQPQRRSRFGGGTGLAMGMGGGLLGGMLLGDALSDSQNDAYMDGYQDGGDYGGGDYGGGDFGGGDF